MVLSTDWKGLSFGFHHISLAIPQFLLAETPRILSEMPRGEGLIITQLMIFRTYMLPKLIGSFSWLERILGKE